ncbi:MAG: DNA polymerase IV [Nitrososphaerales archaeon]|nr:DNA polymerase IV [Nitrososphaerales archaeon]
MVGHMDLDYFYAQVEEVQDPSLRAKPVLVCVFSGRTEDSGVVATANYRAREFGIKSGMPIVMAKKKLGGVDAALIRMQHAKYETVSTRVMQLVSGNVDVLEQTGIDEAYFDLTHNSGEDFGRARETAAKIKEVVLKKEGLTCSVGLGRSKVVAKVASDFKKPDGLTVINPESTEAFLDPLPVTRLYGVGPKATLALENLGVRTVGELSRASAQDLVARFGRRFTAYLHAAAVGLDDEPVSSKEEPTQLSRIITLKQDTDDAEVAFGQLTEPMEDVHRKLGSLGVSFRTIAAIAVLSDLTTRTKSKTFDGPISDLATMRGTTRDLLRELGETAGKEFRRVGVRVSDLAKSGEQTSLTRYLHERRTDSG